VYTKPGGKEQRIAIFFSNKPITFDLDKVENLNKVRNVANLSGSLVICWLILILNFEQFSAVSSFQDKFFERDL